MNKKYFIDAISDETLAKMIDKTLNFEKTAKNRNIKTNLLKIIPVVAAIIIVIGTVNILPGLLKNMPAIPEQTGIVNPADATTSADENESNTNTDTRTLGDSYTFLIVGYSGGNTDTMMLVTFNVKDSKIAVLSIPRDTYVTIPSLNVSLSSDKTDSAVTVGSWSAKINAGFMTGYNAGIRATKDEDKATDIGMRYLGGIIQYTFGIPVDRYVFIDTGGFRKLIDQIGGIDFNVPIDMNYDDPEQNLHIHLKQGLQHLNGDQAEQLVRFREGYVTADIGRIEVQQKFMAALMKKLLNFNLTNINSLFDFSSKYVTTNISVPEAGWFASKLLNVQLADMRVHTLPGEWLGSPLNAYELYKQETMEIINKYYNPYKDDIPESNFNIYSDDIGSYDHSSINTDGTTLDTLAQ
ncbi:MAG: LCP family protein [Oscillospiraceae bacterium]|nr:LCP family protein [Oscillospiraceae bacterium]